MFMHIHIIFDMHFNVLNIPQTKTTHKYIYVYTYTYTYIFMCISFSLLCRAARAGGLDSRGAFL